MEHNEEPTATPARDIRLREALERAREAQAERTDVQVDMRAAEMARLQVLRDKIGDSLEVIPEDNDMFEITLSRGNVPRLWLDMLSFVKMARDRRTYQFLRDTSEGRQTIFESTDPDAVTKRILDYAAHRILEREKALLAASEFKATLVEDAERGEDGAKTISATANTSGSRFGSVVASFILGMIAGVAILLAYGYIHIP